MFFFSFSFSDSGKLYCYGILDEIKLKRHKQYSEPKRISEHLVARIAKCGTTFIVFVTGNFVFFSSVYLNVVICFFFSIFSDCNGIYLIGKFNGIDYPKIAKLNTSGLKDTIYSIYVSRKNEIFLISSAGDVYKSTNDGEVQFERIILFNQNDNIRKFCSGHDFVCVLTGTTNNVMKNMGKN